MADTTRVTFTKSAADRIASVVRIVERGDRDQAPLRLARIAEPATGGGIRIGTYEGSWLTGQSKVVTLKYQTTTPNTFMATNIFVDILNDCAGNNCAIAREGTAWFLIAAGCA